jgi:GAF domain-containing protein
MDRYRTLLEVNNAVINCLGQAELLAAVTAVLQRVMPCDKAGLTFYDTAQGNGRVSEEPLFYDEGLRSHVSAPLIVRGESIGLLGVGSSEPAKYSAADREFLEDVASQIALAAANVRAFEELQARRAGEDDEPGTSLIELERRHIAATLERCRWVIEGNRGAAKVLGLHPNTLRHRLRKLQLKRPSVASHK